MAAHFALVSQLLDILQTLATTVPGFQGLCERKQTGEWIGIDQS